MEIDGRRVLHRVSEPVETEYWVGCSSWLDASLVAEGTFYPAPRMTSEERLRWYARFFDCVEVNATYYALPSFHNSELWAARTPPGFQFSVKAYALMTGHNPKADRLPKEVRALLPHPLPVTARGEIDRAQFPKEAVDLCFEWFRDALKPLADAGKLSYLLFQLAPWVGHSPKVLDYLGSLPERFPGWPIAVEFRNSSWIPRRTDEVLAFLARTGLIYVCVDCPWQPFIPAVTHEWAVLRLHGRNVEGWQAQLKGRQPTVAEKYDYLYSPEELEAMAHATRAFHQKARRVYTKFNNNTRDYPVRNGLALRRLLGQPTPDLGALRAQFTPVARRTSRRRGSGSSIRPAP
ncbi:MAG: DUF72 domain-containing protein [Candidatus Methylomirabilia bacterium]